MSVSISAASAVALPRRVVAPEGLVAPLASVAGDDPEEEGQLPLGLPEGVALQVEEHVPLARGGKPLEPAARLGRPRLPFERPGVPAPHLEPRLIAEPVERLRPDPRHPAVARRGAPSAASVAMPASRSARTWPPRMPATRDRWSSAVHRSPHCRCGTRRPRSGGRGRARCGRLGLHRPPQGPLRAAHVGGHVARTGSSGGAWTRAPGASTRARGPWARAIAWL